MVDLKKTLTVMFLMASSNLSAASTMTIGQGTVAAGSFAGPTQSASSFVNPAQGISNNYHHIYESSFDRAMNQKRSGFETVLINVLGVSLGGVAGYFTYGLTSGLTDWSLGVFNETSAGLYDLFSYWGNCSNNFIEWTGQEFCGFSNSVSSLVRDVLKDAETIINETNKGIQEVAGVGNYALLKAEDLSNSLLDNVDEAMYDCSKAAYLGMQSADSVVKTALSNANVVMNNATNVTDYAVDAAKTVLEDSMNVGSNAAGSAFKIANNYVGVVGKTKDVTSLVKDKAKGAVVKLGGGVSSAFGNAKDLSQSVGSHMKGVISSVTTATSGVKEGALKISSGLGDVGNKLTDGISHGINNSLGSANIVGNGLSNWSTKIGSFAQDVYQTADVFSNNAAEIVTASSDGASKVLNGVVNVSNAATEGFAKAVSDTSALSGNLKDGASALIGDAFEYGLSVVETASGVADKANLVAQTVLSDVGPRIVNDVTRVTGSLTNTALKTSANAKDILVKGIDTAASLTGDVTKLSDAGANFTNNLVTKTSGLLTKTEGATENLLNRTAGVINKGTSSLNTLIANVQPVVQNIESKAEDIMGFVENISDNFAGLAVNTTNNFFDVGGVASVGAGQVVDSFANVVLKAMDTAGVISSQVKTISGPAANTSTAYIGGISNIGIKILQSGSTVLGDARDLIVKAEVGATKLTDPLANLACSSVNLLNRVVVGVDTVAPSIADFVKSAVGGAGDVVRVGANVATQGMSDIKVLADAFVNNVAPIITKAGTFVDTAGISTNNLIVALKSLGDSTVTMLDNTVINVGSVVNNAVSIVGSTASNTTAVIATTSDFISAAAKSIADVANATNASISGVAASVINGASLQPSINFINTIKNNNPGAYTEPIPTVPILGANYSGATNSANLGANAPLAAKQDPINIIQSIVDNNFSKAGVGSFKPSLDTIPEQPILESLGLESSSYYGSS